MGFYIQSAVIDANVINARGGIPAMHELDLLFASGIIQIMKTSVLNIEFGTYDVERTRKAGTYGIIYGPKWIGHTEGLLSGGERPSMMEIIYQTLWGKIWMKGDQSQQKHIRNSFRDAVHIDICWMNKVDYFITNERNILKKREGLYAEGLDVKIMTPNECLHAVKDNLRKDVGTDVVHVLEVKVRKFHPILLGSNDCYDVLIKDVVTGETLLGTHWVDGQIHLETIIYDSFGNKVAQLIPSSSPIIHHDDGIVDISDPSPNIYSIPGAPMNDNLGQYLRIGGDGVSHFVIAKGDETFLVGRILPSGHTLFSGRLYNSKGEVVTEIDKRTFKYRGIEMINSSGLKLPSW